MHRLSYDVLFIFIYDLGNEEFLSQFPQLLQSCTFPQRYYDIEEADIFDRGDNLV